MYELLALYALPLLCGGIFALEVWALVLVGEVYSEVCDYGTWVVGIR